MTNPNGASTTSVWVCETGDYEQRYIFGIYDSPESAVALIKAKYAPPYRVTWDDLERTGEYTATLTGRFEAVQGWSTQHTAHHDLTWMPVQKPD